MSQVRNKAAKRAYDKVYYEKNKARRAAQYERYRASNRSGFTGALYELTLEVQDFKCAICQRAFADLP